MRFNRIKGKDKPQNIIRLPRLNKIRLGIKIQTPRGTSYPKETSFFVVPDEVKKVHGNEPTKLPVMLPVEDETLFMNQSYRCYKANQRMRCHGNGEVAERMSEDGTSREEIKCPSPPDCEFGQKYKCKSMMDLMVVLPEVNMGGVYQISTGSINADIDIRSGIEMARSLFGRISWTPMELSRQEMLIPDPKTGKMIRHWPVKLNPVANIEQVNAIRQDTKRIIGIQENYVLPEPQIEAEEPDTPIRIEELTSPEEATAKVQATTLPPLQDAPGQTNAPKDEPITVNVVQEHSTPAALPEDQADDAIPNAATKFAWTPPDMGEGYGSYLDGMGKIKDQLKKATGSDSAYYLELAKITKDMPGGPFEHCNKIRKLSFMRKAFEYLAGIAIVVSQ